MPRTVVFSAEWDDRAAELRNDAVRIAALRADSLARVLPIWRGQPLIAGEDRGRAGWVAPDHAILNHAPDGWIYLGQHLGAARFAADVSSWEPEALDATALAAFASPVEHHHPAMPGDHRFADLRGVMTRLDPADAALAATARGLMNWHRSHRFCSTCGQPSVASHSGWQRTCPACHAPHFPRTDPVVIMLVRRGDRILLGRSPGWPEGMYSALAGFVEPGESLETAVRREVHEETGITVSTVSYVASQPWPWPNSLMLGFAAEAESEAITLDHELEDALWVTRDEMVQVMAGEHPRIRRPRNGAIAAELVARWLANEI